MYGNSIWDDLKWQFRYGSDLIKLILINITIFLVINLINLGQYVSQNEGSFDLTHWIGLYSNPSTFIYKPWGIITYMFTHEGFWHILWNMLGLYWFGQIVQDMIGKPKVVPIYLLGGIAGGLMYMLAFNFLPVFSSLNLSSINIGASAAVLAIVLAAATISPNYEMMLFLIGPVKIKWIAFVYVILSLINIQYGNAGGNIAHLGGALMGFIFIRQLQRGNDLSRPYYILIDFFKSLFKKKPKLRVEHKKEYASTYSGRKQNKQAETSRSAESVSKQEKLDAILDKINRSSYDSLTKEEKEFLFKISQEE